MFYGIKLCNYIIILNSGSRICNSPAVTFLLENMLPRPFPLTYSYTCASVAGLHNILYATTLDGVQLDRIDKFQKHVD